MHILDFSKTTTLGNRSADILVRSRSSVTPLSGQECPMPLGIEARSHACQRRFGRQRQSGGPVPPHPGPLPGGEGELSAAGRQIEASRHLARRPTEHPLLGERAGVRGNGAYAVSTGRSSEPATLQTRSQFLAAWDILVRSRSLTGTPLSGQECPMPLGIEPMPFGIIRESQRDSAPKPRVASRERPWEKRVVSANPNGVVARWRRGDTAPLGLKIARTLTQGSLADSATLGWRTQSLWDCRTTGRSVVPHD